MSRDLYVEAWSAYAAGKYDEALATANRGLHSDEQLGHRAGVAEALNIIGTVDYKRGNYFTALDLYKRAAGIAEAEHYTFGLGRDWSSIGSTYYRLGRYRLAKQFYEKSLKIRRSERNPDEIARGLNDLANIFQQLGDYPSAISLRRQALHLWEKSDNPAGIADVLDDLGWTYQEMGETQRALRNFREALVLDRQLGMTWAVADAHDDIGLAYLKKDRRKEAIGQFQIAYRIFESQSNRDEATRVLNHIGDVYYQQADYGRALSTYDQALETEADVQNRPVEIITLGRLMQTWQSERKPALAIVFGKRAVNLCQQARQELLSLDPVLQKSFLRQKEAIYRELADLLVSSGRLGEAQHVLDLLKDEEYFAFVRGGLEPNSRTEPVSFSGSDAEPLVAMAKEEADLAAKGDLAPEEQQRKTYLLGQLKAARVAAAQFFDTVGNLRGDAQTSTSIARDEQREAQGLQKDLDPHTVALYTLVSADSYHTLLITSTTMKRWDYTISAEQLRRKVFSFRQALTNPQRDPQPLARELYKIIIGPLESELHADDVKTILWSLDDVLRYVPMAALNDGNKYLVEKYRSVLYTKASSRGNGRGFDENWRVLAGGVSKSEDGLPALPGVASELHAIIRQQQARNGEGVINGKIMLDNDFTAKAFQAALHQNYPLVHIASHFILNPGNESDSFLLAGDGKISLADIRESEDYVFNGVQLLTLSACNTAFGGSTDDGHEIDGLGMLAEEKGARTVMASLWELYDPSTSELMTNFYRVLSENPGISKAEALQRAELALLHGAEPRAANPNTVTGGQDKQQYSHPYYWAPFILIGNWN